MSDNIPDAVRIAPEPPPIRIDVILAQPSLESLARKKREKDCQDRLGLAFYCILIGSLAGFPLYFAGHMPIQNRLERIEQIGPLPCNVSGIAYYYLGGKNGCERTNMVLITYKLSLDVSYLNMTVHGDAGEVGTHCFQTSYDIKPDVERLFSIYGGPRTCYLDPSNPHDMYLDLNDLLASTKDERYVLSIIFIAIAGIGIVAFIILCIKHSCQR